MKKIYEISYGSTNNQLDIALTDENQTLSDMLTWLEQDNSSILVSKNILIDAYDNKLNVFYLGVNADKLLIFKINNSSEVEKSKIGEAYFKDEEKFNSCVELVLVFLKFIYNLLNESSNKKKYKKTKGFYYDKIKVKNSSIEIKCYPELNGAFKVDEKDNKFKVLINNERKREVVIPSPLYPLPHHQDIKVFTDDNTYEWENTVIDDLLKDKVFKPGYFYTNIDYIVNALSNSEEFSVSVDYYVGWTIVGDRLIHHAWAVVDDKYLIDTSRFLREDEMEKLARETEKGNLPLNRSDLVNKLIEYHNEKIPFKDKYVCGKALKNSIYIGVKSNSDTGRRDFNELMRKYPEHPDYLNINKEDGSNKTLNEFYSKVK